MKKNEMKRYDAYKPSGVEWLGEIPAHWEEISNKYIFKIKKKIVGKQSYKYELLSLTLSGVIKRNMDNPTGKFPAEFDTYQEVSKGDFIFCLFDVEETPRTIGLSQDDGMITGAYTVMKSAPVFNAQFLFYFYYNHDQNKSLRHLYTGLRNTISKENFLSYKTAIPSLSEQTTIAKFLTTKITLLDKAIALKEQQITLLKIRRQAIIHQVVTKGLNPDVQMKDSNIDWIGEIPAHWNVIKLKYIVKNISEKCLSKESDLQYTGMENIQSWTGKYIATNSEVEGIANCFKKGDILFGKLRPYLAKVFLAQCDGICSSEFLVYRCQNEILNSFLQTIFLSYSFINLVDSSTYGSKMPRASADFINNQFIILPSTQEQFKIVTYIQNINQKNEITILLKEQEIEKLKEYKATLINAAVTGKINVT